MALIARQVLGLTTLQDGGRPRFRRYGVPQGGAFDAGAMRAANGLLGQDGRAPVLEVLGSLTLEAASAVRVAVTGADAPLTVDGGPAGRYAPLTLSPGQRLTIHPPAVGLRAYVATCGGFVGDLVLGSVSGQRVQSGQRLAVGSADSVVSPVSVARAPALGPIVVVRGPEASLFDFDAFLAADWCVTPHADRVGIRLRGPGLGAAPNQVSEPMCFGAIQVSADGQPILLGPDGPTIGGYPRIAVVRRSHLDLLAHLAPEQMVRFEEGQVPSAPDPL